MTLSKRLQAIADMIPKNMRVIDVGCDHALLDIYLTLEHRNICIASDINYKVLENAKRIVASYGLEQKIEVVQSDGLEKIELEKDDIVVITGMGATTILHILEKKIPEHLIIGSHNDLEMVRMEITKKGFVIQDEVVVYENGIYYVIIHFEKGFVSYAEKELRFGPMLILKTDEITISYFKYLLEKKERIMKQVPEKIKEIFLKEISDLREIYFRKIT